jgi:hypothetical protein
MRIGAFSALAAFFGACVAQAATSGGNSTVDVPRSELLVSSPPAARAERSARPMRLELAASSWVPSSLALDSQVRDASPFRGSGLLGVGLAFHSAPWLEYERFAASAYVGLGFARLKRDGTADFGGVPRPAEQNLYLAQARLGVDGTYGLLPSILSFYADAGLGPVLAVTERTVFDDGRTALGLPIEMGAGLGTDLQWVWGALQGAQLRAGVIATTGEFRGTGLRAGLSVPL